MLKMCAIDPFVPRLDRSFFQPLRGATCSSLPPPTHRCSPKVSKRPHMSARRRPRRSAAQAAQAAAPAVADIPVDPALADFVVHPHSHSHSSSDDDHPGEDDYATQDDDDDDEYSTTNRGGHQQSQQQRQQGQQDPASQAKKRSTGAGSRTAATAWAPEGMRTAFAMVLHHNYS